MQIPQPWPRVYSYYDNANPRQTARGFTFNIFPSLAPLCTSRFVKILCGITNDKFQDRQGGLIYLAPFAVTASCYYCNLWHSKYGMHAHCHRGAEFLRLTLWQSFARKPMEIFSLAIHFYCLNWNENSYCIKMFYLILQRIFIVNCDSWTLNSVEWVVLHGVNFLIYLLIAKSFYETELTLNHQVKQSIKRDFNRNLFIKIQMQYNLLASNSSCFFPT